MVTKAITTMSTTTTAMAMVATLEVDCGVVASGLLVVPRFVVEVIESPSVISGPGSSVVVASVVTCSVMGVQ